MAKILRKLAATSRSVAQCGLYKSSSRTIFLTNSPNNDLILPARQISFFGSKKPVQDDPFIILRASPEDTEEILDLMWESYFPDEPITKSTGLHLQRNEIFDQETTNTLSKGISLIARCKYNGCLVGGCINNVLCPWDADMMEKFACTLKNEKMAELYMFFAYLIRAPDLFDKYCTSQVFEIQMVFVRHTDRKKGLACRLVQASRDLAVDLGYQIIRVDASNIQSAKICEKLKMKLVFELPYCSYIGENMEPVFKVNEPNQTLRVYIDAPLRNIKSC